MGSSLNIMSLKSILKLKDLKEIMKIRRSLNKIMTPVMTFMVEHLTMIFDY